MTGAEAISTARYFADRDDRPDFTETVGGQLEDRGVGLRGLVFWQTVIHGLLQAPEQYAMFENARRARTGLSREGYAAGMGELFAPFSRVAAANPFSAAPTELSAHGARHSDRPQPPDRRPLPALPGRARPGQPGRGRAADLGRARPVGSGSRRSGWVFLRGHADLRNRDLFDRQDLEPPPRRRSRRTPRTRGRGR